MFAGIPWGVENRGESLRLPCATRDSRVICNNVVRARPSQARHLSLKDAFSLSPSGEFLSFASKVTRLSQPNSNPDLGDK